MQRRDTHIIAIKAVADALKDVGIPIVFTGGAIISLLLTEPQAPDVRETDDVDVIVGITRAAEYAALQERLRELGFVHDRNGPTCRFKLRGLTVDIMPAEGRVLGFSSTWFPYAVSSAVTHELEDGTQLTIVNAVALIATKLDAFLNRGTETSAVMISKTLSALSIAVRS